MKHTEAEILKALHVIKDVCEENGSCDGDCPLGNLSECLITESEPDRWNINDESRTTWRGLL